MLLVGDSNIWPVKESILKHGVSAAKCMAYTIDQATTTIKELKITRPPDKVLIHVGTNHLQSKEGVANDVEEIKSKYETLFNVINERFPRSTKVYFSELLLRREDQVREDVNSINSFLQSATRKQENYSVVIHSFNIDDHNAHLRDNRHLNKTGLHILLSNIRLQMLGMSRKNKTRHFSRRFNPRRR